MRAATGEKADAGHSRAKRRAESRQERERERERDPGITWRLIQDLWKRDSALFHAHLLNDYGVEDEDDRNDILSATNFRVAQGYDPERRDTRARFRRYYFESIDSEFIDRWRKAGRRAVRCNDQKLIALSARIATLPSPEDQLISREERAVRAELLERLAVAIDSLPWRQRAALMLSLEEPRPKAAEIALALGTTEGAVRQLHCRARARLRAELSCEETTGQDA